MQVVDLAFHYHWFLQVSGLMAITTISDLNLSVAASRFDVSPMCDQRQYDNAIIIILCLLIISMTCNSVSVLLFCHIKNNDFTTSKKGKVS